MSTAKNKQKLIFIDRLILYAALPIFRPKNGLSEFEATSRAAVMMSWLLKTPVLFVSGYIIGSLIFPPTKNINELSIFLLTVTLIAVIEFVSRYILHLDERIVYRIRQKRLYQQGRAYLHKFPNEAMKQMVSSTIVLWAYYMFWTIGMAMIIFD